MCRVLSIVGVACFILLAGCEPAGDAAAPEKTNAKLPERDGMVLVPGGTLRMGNEDPRVGYPEEEGPIVEVEVEPFWIDTHEVTNGQFREFVEATGYQTVAERKPTPEEMPGVPEHLLQAGSLVFVSPEQANVQGEITQWWQFVPGANWRHPEGPDSDLEGRWDHPVVQIAYEDAVAYAEWAGKRLPTEAEWEHAARGGLIDVPYTWGEDFDPTARTGHPLANTWTGEFPVQNTAADGYIRTAPVGSFPANGYGLHDMAGNVWEWTSTWYRPGHHPIEPTREQSHDPQEPGTAKRVLKGGSYLCAPNYCARYRPAARSRTTPDSGMNHLGFRLVRDAAPATQPATP